MSYSNLGHLVWHGLPEQEESMAGAFALRLQALLPERKVTTFWCADAHVQGWAFQVQPPLSADEAHQLIARLPEIPDLDGEFCECPLFYGQPDSLQKYEHEAR